MNDESHLKGTFFVPLLLSAVAAILMTLLSVLGLLLPDVLYPDPGMREQYLANDPVNILIGLPLFLISFILIRKGKLLGTLLLPGALIYTLYNYIGYALGRPWDWYALTCLALVVLAVSALYLVLRAIDHPAVMRKLDGRISRKVSGWILIVFGLAFIALAVSAISSGMREGTIPPLGEAAVSVADIIVSLGWVAGGIMLLRKTPLGYTAGLGLLTAASSLFLGLILFFFFAPLFTTRPFDWNEVITVLGMGLICFIPNGIYWRGVVRSSDPSQ